MQQNNTPTIDRDDEINLLDLWLVLARRKTLLAGIVAVVLLLSVVAAVLKSDKYLFTTSLEIGSVTEEGRRTLIDKPETMLAKIQEGFIPAVLNEYGKTIDHVEKFKLKARVPKGSELVVIEAKAKEGDAASVKKMQGQIIAMVKEDHSRILDVVRQDMTAELELEKRKLASLQDQQIVLKGDLERAKVLAGLLERQLGDVKSLVDDAIASRKSARATKGDATHAMTLLMIDNEIEQNQSRMAELQERLHVTLPQEQDTLAKKLADNTRDQENAQQKVDQVATALKNIRETRAIIEPTQSLEPVGLTKPLLLLLGVVVGLIFGVFGVFFAEFLARAREKVREESV